MIESKDNKKIKNIRLLKSKKHRRKKSQYVIESPKLISEAINENIKIEYILICESEINRKDIFDIINICNNKNIKYFYVKEKIFNENCFTINTQGILAVVTMKSYNIDELINDNNMVILCDMIQDPGNLGTIIRTSDAFGPCTVLLSSGCVDAYNPKVVRAASGAIMRVPIFESVDALQVINLLKENGYKIISTVVDSNNYLEDIGKLEKACIIIGNEGNGISENIVKNSDLCVTINMTGKVESLNASIAAGIIIYEFKKSIL